jgi:hypothetical protein
MDREPLLTRGGDKVSSDAARSKTKEFEPLFIEYLCLEQFLATSSFWDRFESRWLRQFGYSRMKAKVEAVWAFITSHTMMLEELPTIQEDAKKKFPGLLVRLEELILEAKADMASLERLQPRRFFYAKHFLALRLMTSIRLNKLEKFCHEGWLPTHEIEGLVECLQDKLSDIQRFHPKMPAKDELGVHKPSTVAPSSSDSHEHPSSPNGKKAESPSPAESPARVVTEPSSINSEDFKPAPPPNVLPPAPPGVPGSPMN